MTKLAFITMTLLLSLTLYLTAHGTLDIPPAALPDKQQVLDMHCHVAGIGAGGSGAFISEQLRSSMKYRIYLKAFGVSEADVRQHGDALIVERISERLAESKQVGAAVLLALDGAVDANGQLDLSRTETYIPNEFLAAETAKYANLYFGASVNPYRADALQRLVRAKQNGALLIKWLPPIQHIDPADEKLIPFYRKLIELELPLLTHAGAEHAFTSADNRLGDPQLLRLALDQGVTVIVAHAATSGTSDGQSNMDRLLPLLAKYPNLYTDISSLTQINKLRYLPRLLAEGVNSRQLLYGTDFPLITTGITSPLFSSLRLSPKLILPLLKVHNPWDQDLLLKLAHGVPANVFTNAHQLLIQ